MHSETNTMTAATALSPPLHLFGACQLRPEDSTNDNYAADLQSALRNEIATPEGARDFFQGTYATAGIAAICNGIFRRLSNGNISNEPSLYRLGASFGGGKTHTLITLAAAARHPQLVKDGITPIPAELAPDQSVRIVAFTGEDTDLERGSRVANNSNLRAKSLIGHIAWHLGGESAFNNFKNYDNNLASPASSDIENLLGDSPALILIDEPSQWVARMARDDRYRNNLANVSPLFSALAKAVENKEKAVMVITTRENLASGNESSGDAYQPETQILRQIFAEMDSILSRTAIDIAPSGDADLPEILRRRLFAQIDASARAAVADRYAALCQRSSALIAPPPPHQTTRQWFYDHYPFHPDTLTIVTERVAANDNFQYTRGTLRLLGSTLHQLHRAGEAGNTLLLHPHHIAPDYPPIHDQLTTRINKSEYLPIIKADITDADAAANRIDETRPTRPAQRIARTVLLASLAPIGRAQGLTEPHLTRAVLTPDDADPSVVANAIAEFRKQALYIDDNPSASAVRFTTVPNINRMLVESANSVTLHEIDQIVKQTIADCFMMPNQRSQKHLAAAVFPSESAIPDSPDVVNFGVINYEWLHQNSPGLPDALANFYRHSQLNGGASARPRQYRNNLVILVADPDSNADMARQARRCLAALRIKNNPPDTIQPHQRESLNTELHNAQRDLRLAIQKRYVHLYYPSNDHPIAPDTRLQHTVISAEIAAEKPGDGQYAVIRTLANRGKLLTDETADLDPESWWRRRRNLNEGKVGLAAFKEEFAREPGNYMLLNKAAADALLRKALEREAVIIQTGAGQIIARPGELVHSDDPDAVIYLAANACPNCRHYQPECDCRTAPTQLCSNCGLEPHPGPCAGAPPPALPSAIPPYYSGMTLQPLNVEASELRRHMEQHRAAAADIAALTLQSDRADFVNFVASMLGQNVNATVSYRLRRGADIELNINDMTLAEWSGALARIAPALESIPDARTTEASVTIPGDANTPEQTDAIIARLPASHTAGLSVTFNPKPAP